MIPITSKQREIYDYIINCRRQIGTSPIQKEIAEAFGLSVWAIRYHIHQLKKAGWVTRVDGKKSGVIPTTEATALEQILPMIRILKALEAAEPDSFHALQTEARFVLSQLQTH